MADNKKNFKCNLCSYATEHSRNLTRHMRNHTSEKPFKCQHENCRAAFHDRSSLRIHQRVHNKDDESLLKFHCSLCTYKTGTKGNLTRHLITHSDDKPFSCDVCPFRSKTRMIIKVHQQRLHSEATKIFKCSHPDCQYAAKTKDKLTRHLLVHSSDRPFACCFAECDFKTKWNDKLRHHEMAHRGEKPYKCNLCSFACTYNYNLAAHIRTHTGETPFVCQSCPYRAKSASQLASHRKYNHSGDKPKKKPFKCQHPNCSSAFSTSGALKSHHLVHNKDDESLMKFRCSVCPYKTGLSGSLNRHLIIYSDVKTFSCDLCSYKSKWKSEIQRHQRVIHEKATEIFKCPHPNCEYSAKDKKNLTQHLLVHSSEQLFVCSVDQCGFKTKRKRALKYHEMAHRGEKPFKCNLCPFSSKYRSSLAGHTRTHTGEAPFPCQKCPHRAKTSSNLIVHVKRSHLGSKRKRETVPTNIKSNKASLNCKIEGCGFSAGDNSSLALHLNETHNLPRVTLTKLEVF